MEFKFAPYVGDTKQKSVETVPGQARVFINNVLIAEKEVQKESVPVLFDEREIAAPIVLSTVTLGPILRKGKNKIRVEFEPKNPKLAYHAQMRWTSVTDQTNSTPNTSTNQVNEGVDDKSNQGRAVLEREFVANFAIDLPWHHYPPITTLSAEDKSALTTLMNARIDAFKPNFADLYALLNNMPGVDLAKLKKSKCLDRVYAAGARFTTPKAGQLDFVLSANPEVLLQSKDGPLFRPSDPKVFQRMKDKDVMECGMLLHAFYPSSIAVVRTPAGPWQFVY